MADGLGIELDYPSDLPMALFDHAEKLTLSPWTVRQASIEHLRQAGFADLGILQITMLVAYLNFENRVILGLRISSDREDHA